VIVVRVLEDHKLLHRVIDVAKAAAEVRARELENLRLVARLRGGQLGVPVHRLTRRDGAAWPRNDA